MIEAGQLNETILDMLVPNPARDLPAIVSTLAPED